MNRKENIKKIILIVVCIGIIIFIFVRNIFGGVGSSSGVENNKPVDTTEGITRQEAYRLLSYVLYERAEREGLEKVIEGEAALKHPYYSYINALAIAEVIENKDMDNLFEKINGALTCGEFKDILTKMAVATNVEYKSLISDLPERLKTVKRGDKLYLNEFLSMYETLVERVTEKAKDDNKKINIKTKEVFFLGTSTKDPTAKKVMDYNGDEYYYGNLKDYSVILKNGLQTEGKSQTDNSDNTIESYIDVPTNVLICGDELVYVKEILEKEITLSNAWIIEGKSSTMKLYISGLEKEYQTILPLSSTVTGKIGDITVKEGVIQAVTVKPDTISGKVLLTTKKEIEIEGYGKLPFNENFKIYKVHGTLSMEKTSSILVGYTITDFVVSDGEVCAALIKEDIKAKDIRVLINTTGYQSVFHDSVTFTSDQPFLIAYGDKTLSYKANEEVTIKKEDDRLEQGRLKITTLGEGEGKIKLLSVKRSYGRPEYRGSIEIAKTDNGLTIVNEVSLEEYLYSVVPSEMPASYGAEALKVQAVCARSFAYNQLLQNKYSAYGAHVDDSVNSQVYNNIKESEDTILAVKDTYGQVLKYDNKVLTAYYFATSSGYTASVEDVWESSTPMVYLNGNLQTEEKQEVDLSNDDKFRAFIDHENVDVKLSSGVLSETVDTYDSGFLMYRWNVTISVEDLSKRINDTILNCYNTNKNSILTLVSTNNKEGLVDDVGVRVLNSAVFKSEEVRDIGTVKNMKVIKRGKSGIIKELLITGTKATVLVCYQTNIRQLLAPVNDNLYRLDGSSVSSMAMLPSAFFYIDAVGKGENVTAFTLTGGGYGHGVGMSQNGVKKMIDQGKTYDEVLKHYYTGVELGLVYE